MDMKTRIYCSDLNIKIRLGSLLINVLCINYEPPRPPLFFKNHAHSSYELHFVSDGCGTLRIEDESYDIKPGTFYLTGPGIYHEQKSNKEDPMNEFCINFEFANLKKKYKEHDASSYEDISEITEILKSTTFWFGCDPHGTYRLFEKIFNEIDSQNIGYYTSIQSIVTQIIINAVRCYSNNEKTHHCAPKKVPYDRRRVFLDECFILHNLPTRQDDLAQRLGVSTKQLNRIMHKYYSMSFKQKLLQTRIDIAKDLLKNTAFPIEEISFRVGYTNVNYFYKLFRQKTNMTPSKYRAVKCGISD